MEAALLNKILAPSHLHMARWLGAGHEKHVAATTLACTPSKYPPAVSQYDEGKPLEAFTAKLRHETDLQALNNDLVGVVREAMQRPPRILVAAPRNDLEGGQGQ